MLLLLGLFVAGFVTFYVNQEHFFYFYDGVGYHSVAVEVVNLFSEAPFKALSTIRTSVQQEYNTYYTLPLIPWLLVFGESRLAYLSGIALFYQLPYILLMGALAARLLPEQKRLAFLIAALVALINPTAWGALLRGLPDVGAASLIALAAWIALYDLSLKRWWQMVGVGVSLALAIIFRRHFTYAVIAFYTALLIQVLLVFLRQRRNERSPAKKSAWMTLIRIGLTSCITIITLVIIAYPMLVRIFTVNYATLYASYEWSVTQLVRFFGEQYGWILILLALAGIIWGLRTRLLNADRTIFILIFGSISVIAWFLFAGQRGTQYTLHFTFLIILGMTTLVLTSWDQLKPRWRGIVTFGLAGYLLLNGMFGLLVEIPYPAWKFFSFPYRPQIRSDYAEVERLVETLHQNLPQAAQVYVVDSSYKMNSDLLRKAEQARYGKDQALLNILDSPIVDSRDRYPLEELLKAQVVILSTPLQTHLRPEEQDVVSAVYNAFTEDWEIARDFELLPEAFNLADDTVLRIYRRTRPTSLETALRTFDQMKAQINERPGSQLDWLLLNPEVRSLSLGKSERMRYELRTGGDDKTDEATFLFVETPPDPGKLEVWAKFSPVNCGELQLSLFTSDEQGNIQATDSRILEKNETQYELSYQDVRAKHLLFTATLEQVRSKKKACSVDVWWKLAISPLP